MHAASRGITAAARQPINAPAATSVGKCTYKYILEKAIRHARINAAMPAFLLYVKRTQAEANDAAACPDGNE